MGSWPALLCHPSIGCPPTRISNNQITDTKIIIISTIQEIITIKIET
jgi:hypothetical protein